jgi:hypothetical protein
MKGFPIGLVAAVSLALSGTASAGEPIANPNASCVGFGITQFAPEQEGDDVAHLVKSIADAAGIPKGQVTASFARIGGNDPSCPANQP